MLLFGGSRILVVLYMQYFADKVLVDLLLLRIKLLSLLLAEYLGPVWWCLYHTSWLILESNRATLVNAMK